MDAHSVVMLTIEACISEEEVFPSAEVIGEIADLPLQAVHRCLDQLMVFFPGGECGVAKVPKFEEIFSG